MSDRGPSSAGVRLVVPCFDEAARLPLDAWRAGLASDPGLSLTLVDDGSRDGTRAVLYALAAAAPDRVEVVGLPENRGKGEAVRAGLLAALAHRPVFAGWWDADLATPLSEVARLRAVLEAEPSRWLAMGARVAALGARIERRALRHVAGRLVATAIARTLRMTTYDTQCGAKVFRVAGTPPGLFDAPFVTRWLFDVEVLLRLPAPASMVVEVPLLRWTDVPGSKVGPLAFPRAFFDLWRLRRRRRATATGA